MFKILFAIILSPVALVAGAFSVLFIYFSIKSIFTKKKARRI